MGRPRTDVLLRAVVLDDLPDLFAHMQNPVARRMAAFTAKDPSDEDAFLAHWTTLLRDETVLARTVVVDGELAGHVLSYQQLGRTEVTYWVARPLWGQGIATAAARPRRQGQHRLPPRPPALRLRHRRRGPRLRQRPHHEGRGVPPGAERPASPHIAAPPLTMGVADLATPAAPHP